MSANVDQGTAPIVNYQLRVSQNLVLFNTPKIGVPGLDLPLGFASIGISVQGELDAGVNANLQVGFDSGGSSTDGFFLNSGRSNPLLTLSFPVKFKVFAGISSSLGDADLELGDAELKGSISLTLGDNPSGRPNYRQQDFQNISFGNVAGALTFTITVHNPFSSAGGIGELFSAVTQLPDPLWTHTWTLFNQNASSNDPENFPPPPTVTISAPQQPVDEGASFHLVANISGGTTVKSILWKQISGPDFYIESPGSQQTWVDGVATGSVRFTVIVTDTSNQVASATATVTVDNVSPLQVHIDDQDASQGTVSLPPAVEGFPYPFTTNFWDPSVVQSDIIPSSALLGNERFYHSVDFGDGTSTGLLDVAEGLVSLGGIIDHRFLHTYRTSGNYTITYTPEDDHDLTNPHPRSYTASLQVLRANLDTRGNLLIGGTSGNDTIQVMGVGSGNVSVTVNGATQVFHPTGVVLIHTGTGNDTVTLGTGIGMPVYVVGGGGTDTLVGPNSSNTWHITGKNQGNVDGSFFTGFQNLIGGASDDRFIFAVGAGVDGTVDGGGGSNTLDFSAWDSAPAHALRVVLANRSASQGIAGGAPDGFDHIQKLVGGAAQSVTLVGWNTDVFWDISNRDTGYLTEAPNDRFDFSGVKNLVGYDHNDTFRFEDGAGVDGTVDGGGGANALDFSPWYPGPKDALTVNLANRSASQGIDGGAPDGFANIQQLIGGQHAVGGVTQAVTLVGWNTDHDWYITGPDAGYLTEAPADRFDFSGVQNLVGNFHNDTFNVSVTAGVAYTLSVDGGQGTNSLKVSGASGAVILDRRAGPNSGTVQFSYLNGSLGSINYANMQAVGTNPGTTRSYVQSLYHQFLNRDAGQTDIDYWESQLGQGVQSVQVARSVLGSAEYQRGAVAGLYTALLGRAADAGGLAYYAAALQGGGTVEQVQAGIAGSVEYYRRAGGTPGGFVDALYRDLLGRAADAGGRAYLLGLLAGGASRADAAASVLASAEYRQGLVKGWYQAYLHRAADAFALQYWGSALQAGARDEDVIAGITGSDEYSNIPQRFFTQVYRDVLGRGVDDGGLSYWSSALHGGTSRAQVARSVLASAEYQRGAVAGLYTALLGRAADPGGLAFYAGVLQGGGTLEQVQASLAGSDEYFRKAGGTAGGFIDALYRDLLGRAADPGGRGYWLGLLAGGASRTDVAAGVLGSADYRQGLVKGWYQTYLRRPADAFALQYWGSALQAGARDEDVIAGLIGSSEYFNRL